MFVCHWRIAIYAHPPGVRGKEKGAVGELYDVFESVSAHSEILSVLFAENAQIKLASEMWPEDPIAAGQADKGSDSDENGKPSLEEQVAREVSAMKRPRRESRFGMFCGS